MQQRQDKIIAYLAQFDEASVQELAEHCSVSIETIRRDLNRLDKNGCYTAHMVGRLVIRKEISDVHLVLAYEQIAKLNDILQKMLSLIYNQNP